MCVCLCVVATCKDVMFKVDQFGNTQRQSTHYQGELGYLMNGFPPATPFQHVLEVIVIGLSAPTMSYSPKNTKSPMTRSHISERPFDDSGMVSTVYYMSCHK